MKKISRKLMYTKVQYYTSHIPSTIEFVAIDCQIRSSFCQFGCEVIAICYVTGGRTIRRCHAYLHLPSLRSKPQPWYRFTITSLSSLLDNAGSFWWLTLRATDALGLPFIACVAVFGKCLWKGKTLVQARNQRCG
jgi:hypothetical protein